MNKLIFNTSLFFILFIGIFSLSNTAEALNIGSLRSAVTPGFSFVMDLKLGDTDPAVKELQKILNADPATIVAAEEVGSPGKESTYFGSLTKEAVIKFQNKYKDVILTLNSLTTADGVVNKATRTKLNLLLSVMTTYDSVGSPQGQAGSGPVNPTYVAPVVVATPTQPSISICSFAELLIRIGIITPTRAPIVRSTLNCPAVGTTPVTGPFVDIKVNGKNGPLTLDLPQDVTVSWTSSGVTSCRSGSSVTKPVSGSQTVSVKNSGAFQITCVGPSGSVSDSVIVTNSDSEDLIITASVQASTTKATFTISTNNAATYKLSYGLTSATVSNVTIPGTNTTKTYELTGLTANTKYYYKVLATDSNGGKVESSVGNFNTLPISGTTNALNPKITVLYVIPNMTSALFVLSTDKSTTAVINYGIEGQNQKSVGLSPASIFKQKQVDGLTANTTYSYQAIVTDLEGRVASSTVRTFKTLTQLATSTGLSGSEEETEEEFQSPENPFAGVVVSVNECADLEDVTEVVIDPCPPGTVTATIMTDGPVAGGPETDVVEKTLTSQIKITIRNWVHDIPKVGETIFGKAVHDDALICGETAASSLAEHVGTITGQYGHEPAAEGQCQQVLSVQGGGAPGGGGFLGGVVAGAAAGAAIGSFIPGVGTVVGGFIGGIAGGIASLF